MFSAIRRAATDWNPTTFEAVDAAARARLAARGHPDFSKQLGELAEWQTFGLEVIVHYERLRRERNLLEWRELWAGIRRWRSSPKKPFCC